MSLPLLYISMNILFIPVDGFRVRHVRGIMLIFLLLFNVLNEYLTAISPSLTNSSERRNEFKIALLTK